MLIYQNNPKILKKIIWSKEKIKKKLIFLKTFLKPNIPWQNLFPYIPYIWLPKLNNKTTEAPN